MAFGADVGEKVRSVAECWKVWTNAALEQCRCHWERLSLQQARRARKQQLKHDVGDARKPKSSRSNAGSSCSERDDYEKFLLLKK
jgi:hypothetical protein